MLVGKRMMTTVGMAGLEPATPLVPNQVRYRLRYIPLLAGVLLGPRSSLLIGSGAHRMRPTIRKVISNRSATSLWLRAERWYVVGDAV